MILRTRFCLMLILSLFSAHSAGSDLPNTLTGTTVSGLESSSLFFAGATADAGASYDSTFDPSQLLHITVEIQPEAQHVGSTARLYVVAQSGQQLYMQVSSGEFIAWDGLLETLTPRVSDITLATTETLTVLDNTPLALLGVQNTAIEFYFAYSTSANEGEIYYSANPLTVGLSGYDPLTTIFNEAQIVDTVVFDENRDREIPVLMYLAERSDPAPTLLFSHGLGGDRFAVGYLAEHWSARGFNVINLQHPGSDTSFHEGLPASEILAAFQEAANLSNSIARVEDVFAVLDQLETWTGDPDNDLFSKIDLQKIGMSGHSFGARTTMATSGEEVPTIPGETQDLRIKAAVVFSPSPPGLGTVEEAFGEVELPWLLMTGTLDESVVNDVTAEQRQLVYPALPPGGKYELVLFEGEHHAFTDRDISASQNPRNPAHHPQIMALTTAFWEAWLLGNSAAREWLDGTGAESSLQPGDSWQFK